MRAPERVYGVQHGTVMRMRDVEEVYAAEARREAQRPAPKLSDLYRTDGTKVILHGYRIA